MQLEHEKCLEIMFHSNAHIEPSLPLNWDEVSVIFSYTIRNYIAKIMPLQKYSWFFFRWCVRRFMTAQTTKAIGWKDDLTPQKPSKKKGLSQQIQEPSLDRFVTNITDLFHLKTLLELMIWIHKMIESDVYIQKYRSLKDISFKTLLV